MLMICNHAGKTPDCAICPESKPHNPTAPPKGFGIEKSFCFGNKTRTEVRLIPAATKEEAMSTETKEVTYTPPEIEMIPVESSNIESVGHDGAETLRIRFKGSATRPATDYDYPGATEQDFFDIINAESAGRAYQAFKGKGIKGIKLEGIGV